MLQLVPGGFLKKGGAGEFTSINVTDEDTGYQIDGNSILWTGDFANRNMFLGKGVAANNTGTSNVFIGENAGRGAAAGATGDFNVMIGRGAGIILTTSSYNLGIGCRALESVTTSPENFGLGAQALLKLSTGSGGNIGIGVSAMAELTAGRFNVSIGKGAGGRLLGTSEWNTLIGYQSGYGMGEKDRNVCIGAYSGRRLTTGQRNIFIGYSAGSQQTILSDRLIVDDRDRGSAANEATMALIYGVFAAAAADQDLTFNANVFLTQVKAGASQAAVGAAAGEIWRATDWEGAPGSVLMIGL